MALSVSSHPFIKRFPPDQAGKISAKVRLSRYSNKALIFDEGALSESICLVLDGRVALVKKTPGGTPQTIAHKASGDYFGELGVLDGSNRSTAAFADGPAQIGHIPRQAFLDLLSEVPSQTVLQLFSQVSENLRETNARYVTEMVRKEKITLVGEMANSMIHDFRNPFTTIQLAAETLAMCHDDEKTKRLSNMILRQVDRLGGMVEEVLEFARGETRLQIKPVLLQDLFSELQENNPSASLSGVQLLVKSTPLVLRLDRDRFQRVLQNLVTNASEALAGTKDAQVTVSARQRGDACVVTVTDNGPGIPELIRDTLFEPFVSHGKSGGTGLGLALVRSVVDAHSGTITFKTSAAGTTFVIKLPRKS
jgi:signal transduction histidine kinase